MKEPIWIIYCHTHIVSGRRYIGLTKKTMMARWNQHVYNAEFRHGKGCAHFWAAIRKYGKEAFKHEILGTYVSLEEANSAENLQIEELGTRDPRKGFNLARGGGHRLNPERRNPWQDQGYREKMTVQNRRTVSRPEVKRKIGNAARGRVFSEETRRKISANTRGKTRDPEVVARISATMKAKDWSGKILSAETRKKISEAGRGRTTSQETKDRLSASGRARPKATHCQRGHEFSSENTHVNRKGARECRTCTRLGRKRCYQARTTAKRANSKAA